MTGRFFLKISAIVLGLAIFVIPYALSSVEMRSYEDVVGFHTGGLQMWEEVLLDRKPQTLQMWEEVLVNHNAIDPRDFEAGIP